MYDSLLVYENFPTGGISAKDDLVSTGVTFRPAAVESLTHSRSCLPRTWLTTDWS